MEKKMLKISKVAAAIACPSILLYGCVLSIYEYKQIHSLIKVTIKNSKNMTHYELPHCHIHTHNHTGNIIMSVYFHGNPCAYHSLLLQHELLYTNWWLDCSYCVNAIILLLPLHFSTAFLLHVCFFCCLFMNNLNCWQHLVCSTYSSSSSTSYELSTQWY